LGIEPDWLDSEIAPFRVKFPQGHLIARLSARCCGIEDVSGTGGYGLWFIRRDIERDG